MKKSVSLLLAGAMCAGLLAGCSSSSTSGGASAAASGSTAPSSVVSGEAGSKSIEKLSIAFVPSREPEEIITATEPLKEMLTAELAGLGYDVGEVEITVGTSYEAVGEALSAGTADVGLIPGGTYVLYDDGCDVLLTATRDGLSIDSDSAKDWNDTAPTEATTNQVTSYRALMIAGPSEKGQALAAKVNAGEDLTWEDVSGVNWSVMGSSSPAGYIYPSLWLQEQFDKNITELPHAVQSDSYGSAFARLASGQIDVLCTYADARRDYAERWNTETGKRTGVGIRLHSAAQIRNALAVAILQPQSRVDVTGRGGRAHDAPVGAVEIIPGQFFTGVDLGGQFLTLFGRAGDEQCTVGDSLLVGSLGGLAVVPVLGVVGVLAQTVAGRGQDNLCTVIIQNVGAAGDQANVDGAGFQTFADRLIGGADGDLNVLDVVAFLGQFVLEQLFERLSRSDDLLRLAGGNKSDLQRFNGLGCRVGGFCGIVGVSGVGSVSRFSGCLRVLCGLIAAVCSVRAFCSAAGQNAEQHHERKQKCKNFLL